MIKRTAFIFLSILCCAFVFSGCSSDSSSSSDGGGSGGSQTIADLSIGVSSASVSSDNSDFITVTASVLNGSNVAVSGTTISFSATGGALSAASVITDESGLATVEFRSGLTNKSNRQVVIEASSGGLSAQVPVLISGTSVEAMPTQTVLTIGGSATDELSIFVSDASGTPIFDTSVSISIRTASTGSASISPSQGQTDVNGKLNVSVTGTNAGTVTIDITAAGAADSQTYTVNSASSSLAITQPSQDPSSSPTGPTGAVSIIVADPQPGPSNQVVIATTLGQLVGGGNVGSAIVVPVTNGTAQAQLTSTEAGVATVQAYDVNSPTVTDSVAVAFYAPANQASKISIQASNTVVAPSETAILNNSVEITASVVNATDDVVGQAPVVFTLANTTGGGEKISPTLVLTDESGIATATFTSGSLSSGGEGVLVSAYLLNSPSVSSTIPIIIGGTPGSVVLGTSTEISSINGETAYQLDVSVIVADTNGNPVSGADVTLSLWPTFYYTGNFMEDTLVWTGTYSNEDINQNTFLDPGEDVNGSGALEPGNSAAGTIPGTVTTDENGIATFQWTYLKTYAGFVAVDLYATTIVQGSETTSRLHDYVLRWADGEEPNLGPSPFNSFH